LVLYRSFGKKGKQRTLSLAFAKRRPEFFYVGTSTGLRAIYTRRSQRVNAPSLERTTFSSCSLPPSTLSLLIIIDRSVSAHGCILSHNMRRCERLVVTCQSKGREVEKVDGHTAVESIRPLFKDTETPLPIHRWCGDALATQLEVRSYVQCLSYHVVPFLFFSSLNSGSSPVFSLVFYAQRGREINAPIKRLSQVDHLRGGSATGREVSVLPALPKRISG